MEWPSLYWDRAQTASIRRPLIGIIIFSYSGYLLKVVLKFSRGQVLCGWRRWWWSNFGKTNYIHDDVLNSDQKYIYANLFQNTINEKYLWSRYNHNIIHVIHYGPDLKTSWRSGVICQHISGSTLVQVMSCHLLGVETLPEPMLTYCRLNPLKQTSVKFLSKFQNFNSIKCVWICCLRNVRNFVQN